MRLSYRLPARSASDRSCVALAFCLFAASPFRQKDFVQGVPPGFEPGMADLPLVAELVRVRHDVRTLTSSATSGSPQGKPRQDVAETPSISLAHTLARETQSDPDLARLIDAWPSLPPTVKRMILAALEVSEPG